MALDTLLPGCIGWDGPIEEHWANDCVRIGHQQGLLPRRSRFVLLSGHGCKMPHKTAHANCVMQLLSS